MANWFSNWWRALSGGGESVEQRNISSGSLKDDAILKTVGLHNIYASTSPKAAMGIATFFGCVKLISNLTSANPFGVFRELEGGGSDKARKHPLDYLLSVRPNAHMTPVVAIRTLVANFSVWGFAIAQILRNGNGDVVGYIPYASNDVTIFHDNETNFYFFRVDKRGVSITLSEDDVIFIKDLSFDGECGTSIVNWQSSVIKLDLLASGFIEKYYENGTFIGGFLETPLNPTDENAAKAYKKRVVEGLKGAETGGYGFSILGPGIKWHPVSRTPLESQLNELFGKSDRDFAKMFNVPLSLIGDTEKQTSWGSGVEQMFIGVTRSVLIPIATQIEQEFNYKCFTRKEIAEGYYTKFNFRALLRGDSASYASYIRTMINTGVYSQDYARALEELPPIPDKKGNRYWIQSAMMPLDKIDEFIDSKKTDGKRQEVPASAN